MHTAGIEAKAGPFFDLDRALAQAGPEQLAPAAAASRPKLSLGLVLSLVLHLSPLLLLLPWRGAPVEVPPPIPVQLVIEQPPPPPPAPVARVETVAKPPQGRLASEEVGEKAEESEAAPVAAPSDTQPEADTDRQAEDQVEPESKQAASLVEPQPQPTEPSKQAKAPPEPELRQAANFVQPQLEPTLLDREALALPAPKVEPLPERSVAPVSARQPAPGPTSRPRPPQHAAAVIGPPAARNEYLAHLVTLVRPYLRLLSPDIVNGRRGTTSLDNPGSRRRHDRPDRRVTKLGLSRPRCADHADSRGGRPLPAAAALGRSAELGHQLSPALPAPGGSERTAVGRRDLSVAGRRRRQGAANRVADVARLALDCIA